jgi:hypothetical protein
MSEALGEATKKFGDVRWRLNNLYYITDKAGICVPFRLNWAQLDLLENMHFLNIILKARQLGFSTFIQIYMLDQCVFNSNVSAGTIADTRDNAELIFRTKAKFPYERLPEAIKAANPATQDSARQLMFMNGSSLVVGTSLRSGTYQYLHVSEYGKICAKYPEKAQEVRTGALNTVQAGQLIFIESTAEGQTGNFHDMCEKAQTAQRRGMHLTPLDFKFHFYPWWKEPEYRLDPAGVEIPDDMAKYFSELEEFSGVTLSLEQKAWYVKKQDVQQEDMLKEYPSTPEEAFKGAIEGSIFGKWIYKIEREGQITKVPHDPSLKVNTWWDLGQSTGNAMAIWFWQQAGPEFHFIDYLENTLEDLDWYILELQRLAHERKLIYGFHGWPHDGGHVRLGNRGKSLDEIAYDLGLKTELQGRYDIGPTITRARQLLPRCWFDAEHCAAGLKALRSFRYEWNEEHGRWSTAPLHDWASNGASAFRTGAMALGDFSTAESGYVRPKRNRYSTTTTRRASPWAA